MNSIEEIYRFFRQHTGGVCTDTRQMKKGALFFALSGENFNGNRFAAEALEKGAAAVVVDDPAFVSAGDSRYFLVENTLKSLQELAAYHRARFHIPVLGITGTNGKTTTKELCTAVLSTEKNTCATRGNLNNHIGVPLTLLEINDQTEIAVVEMGANHPGEIAQLCQWVKPTHGLITNIGKAHLEGFGNFESIIKTKTALYRAVQSVKGTLFVHKDNDLLMRLSSGTTRVTYGTPPADFSGILKGRQPFISVEWHNPEGIVEIKSKLYGSYNFSNVMAAIAVGKYFGISNSSVEKAIGAYKPENNRSQLIHTKENTIVLDAYNANPESMKLAIEDFSKQNFPHPVLVLGDMFELGKAAVEEHEKIIKNIDNKGFEEVFLVGDIFHSIPAKSRYKKFKTTEDFIRFIRWHPIKKAQILVKGSRGMQLEKTIRFL
jgi:UDP-N-acetylmuramoyl-tripeptide--D-alanyl-D-alanine ligase